MNQFWTVKKKKKEKENNTKQKIPQKSEKAKTNLVNFKNNFFSAFKVAKNPTWKTTDIQVSYLLSLR